MNYKIKTMPTLFKIYTFSEGFSKGLLWGFFLQKVKKKENYSITFNRTIPHVILQSDNVVYRRP